MLTFIRRIILALIFALIFGTSLGAAQDQRRLKVYIKIESEKNEWKITSSLRRQLNRHPKHKEFALFVFPVAQKENNPDLTFIVKDHLPGGWLQLSVNGKEPGVMAYSSDCEDIARDILMLTAVNVRILAVGKDQALEEWATAFKNGYEKNEKADGARKQKNGANANRTKSVKKP